MDIRRVLNITEIILSIALVIVVVLQQQGSGMGVVFGGGGGESYRSKRGVERLLFNLTIILIVVFIINGLAIAIANVNR